MDLSHHLEVKEAERSMGRQVDQLVEKSGMRPIRWARLCFTLTAIYTVLNLLAGLYRADFLNITVCAVAIFVLTSPEVVDKQTFRALVGGTLLSFTYDLLWHFMKDTTAEAAEDGGVEQSVRSFTYWIGLLMMTLKIVMSFVYWKASLDFAAIIDERSVLVR